MDEAQGEVIAGNSLVVDKDEFAERGEMVYQRIRAQLEPQHRGEIVAIEPDSGDCFLGDTTIEAVDRGRERYPNRLFYLVRGGYRTAVVFR